MEPIFTRLTAMIISRFSAVLLAGILVFPAQAADLSVVTEVRAWRQQHEQQIVQEFSALLSLPNVARNRDDIRANAVHIMELFRQAGLTSELLEVEGGNPAVYAERLVPDATTTIMVYVHYDGQPVSPADWASDPWQPILRDGMVEAGGQEVPMAAPFDPEWRIFARSAGDDKAPIIAMKSALEALDAASIPLTVNLKMFLDGEEEAGSPGLRAMLEKHRDRLGADLWLLCDGPMHQSRRQHLVYGVRGSVGFNLTVYGANRPLHSGHYGNWAPNPIVQLTALSQSMRDPGGNIYIDGFHDQVRPLTESEKAAVAASPRVDEQLLAEFGISRPETEDRIELAVLRPGLNLRGIRSGDVGSQSRNAIQPTATASIGLRLVPDQTPEYMQRVVEQHIRGQGFAIIHDEPTARDRESHLPLARIQWASSGGYPAYRTAMDHPLAQQVSNLLDELHDGQLIQTPTMGGSLPIYVIDEVLGAPVLILPVANHDNNQHGANENLRLQNLWDAIETYAAVLTGMDRTAVQ
jgi:acetylornithine deacetylase/succinyl-diaminopimelate desuccinylase-like protein